MNPPQHDFDGLLLIDKPGLEKPVSPRETDTPSHASFAPDGADPGGQRRRSQPDERLYTSHDIVQLTRRWSHQRRVGHTGTLDPMASGLLVLCLGRSTRLVEYYQGHDKQYYAEIQLGTSTDTYDALGQITARAAIPSLSRSEIDRVLDQFRGSVMQRPPAFSALKQGGESLHRKARRGESVEIEARPITIHSLDTVDWVTPDRLCLRVVSSAGTYIRSLAHDIGRALGTEAHLSCLRRERAGHFDVMQAHKLDEIRALAETDRLAEIVLPPGYGLDLPRIGLTEEQLRLLGFGQNILMTGATHGEADQDATSASMPDPGWHVEQLAQGIQPDGQFAGILRCVAQADPPEEGFFWKAKKWFASNQ